LLARRWCDSVGGARRRFHRALGLLVLSAWRARDLEKTSYWALNISLLPLPASLLLPRLAHAQLKKCGEERRSFSSLGNENFTSLSTLLLCTHWPSFGRVCGATPDQCAASAPGHVWGRSFPHRYVCGSDVLPRLSSCSCASKATTAGTRRVPNLHVRLVSPSFTREVEFHHSPSRGYKFRPLYIFAETLSVPFHSSPHTSNSVVKHKQPTPEVGREWWLSD
jgi:hypothetical protein